jgi:glycosyltransferase involved in cell wall biosynthesis
VIDQTYWLGKRIGMFVSLGIGGADRSSLQLAIGLRELGLDVILIISENSFPRRTFDQDSQSRISDIRHEYMRLGFALERIDSMMDLVQLDLDLLHVQRSGEDLWLLPNLETVVHQFPIVETNFHGKLQTPASFRIFPSSEIVGSASESNQNWKVIPNPIMVPSNQDGFRNELALKDEFVLGRIARSDKSTYSPKLLIVFRALEQVIPNLRLIWVGESSMAKRDAKLLGCRQIIWVPTTSSHEEVSRWYKTFDLFCHFPKLGETFGNSVAEAMMHGLCCVSVLGKRNYPQAQVNVINDPRQSVSNSWQAHKRIKFFWDFPTIRQAIGQRNKTFAEAEYSRASVAKQYADIFMSEIKKF